MVEVRLNVLDTGASVKELCRKTGVVHRPQGVDIAYEVYSLCEPQVELQARAGDAPADASPASTSGCNNVLMIMGFAAVGQAWLPTLSDLFKRGDKVRNLQVCVFDNRGIGRSTVPADKKAYTTTIMAQDALGVMDQLGWAKAHVVGHSMGGMIAARLGCMAPERVASLMLVSVSGGGMEAFPVNWRALVAAFKGAGAGSDMTKRARADLLFHFTPKLIAHKDPATGRSVRDLLVDDYINTFKNYGMQTKASQDGHLNAVMTHHLSRADLQKLREAGFPIMVVHGTDDILAVPRHAARLARQLSAPLVMLDGAHFITRDCAPELNDELVATIEAVRKGVKHVDAVQYGVDPRQYLVMCGCLPVCA
ncbi:hypothetical protein HYH03_015963 [Edaphochlamys debaryana]|uniref:AB hydrolase-1 domain-containing protein n=1 Tax=Edaphochlamys debaryana TaxID=47281 RepID=A0A835XM39_9CHLO|nr:hypothetical protein HYH03_015963 [Edaphochlamys debaryana]|eukprot:KAG2485288.1 hypothetical protein HYH03_015963 [Edaphochlamys debaryana]